MHFFILNCKINKKELPLNTIISMFSAKIITEFPQINY